MADWGSDIQDADGFLRQWLPRVRRDINHPSIITWVPLNEQRADSKLNDSKVTIYEQTRQLDPTRPVANNSGWGHAKTDIVDLHVNPRDYGVWWNNWQRSITEHGNWWIDKDRPAFSGDFQYEGQPVVISEMGLWTIDGFPPQGPWEPYPSNTVGTVQDYLNLYREVILSLMGVPGIAGFSYVQLYDVEGEINGYLTYDRKPKVSAEAISEIHTDGLSLRNVICNGKTLLPSSSIVEQMWLYTTQKPATDWSQISFDDSNWKKGKGMFGTEGTPNVNVGTEWSGSDIWLRRQFTLDAIPKDTWLMIYHDEVAEVYLNGVLAVTVEGFTTDFIFEDIFTEAKKSLHKGLNTIAVHCKNTSGKQAIDVGLVASLEEK
jgi:hypothetical protein